jgi:hypothetical protein
MCTKLLGIISVDFNIIREWLKGGLGFIPVQEETTCQNDQTLTPFQDILPLH